MSRTTARTSCLTQEQPLTEDAEKERRDISDQEKRQNHGWLLAKCKGTSWHLEVNNLMIQNSQTQKKEDNMVKPKKAKPTNRDRVDLINFIIDAIGDKALAKKFLDCKTAQEIRMFFKDNGYDDIPLNDCKDILTASKNIHGHGVSDAGEPVYTSVRRGY